jgi:signal transduction histidine kinase
MTVLSRASELLSTSQGSLVYYLLVLWALFAGLGLALGEWRRTRDEDAQRLALALGGMVLARAIYAIAALVSAADWINGIVLLPPLERFADTVSIGLLAWALMPRPRRETRTWDWVFGVNLTLSVAVCLIFIVLWGQALAGTPKVGYNTYWQATVWAVWQLSLLLLGSFAVIRGQGEGWGTFFLAMGFMFAGVLMQWAYPASDSSIPTWQRLANLAAYPLIAVAVYQEVITGLRVRSREFRDISQASLDHIKSLLNLFEASQQTSSTLDLPTVLDNAARGIARVLDADQCAIVFPEEGDSGTMRLVAIYNPTRQGRGEAVTFPLEYQLTVQQAIRRRKPVVIEETDNVQLKVLFALLGSSGETGPLLVQPLLTEKGATGAIIAGNARSRRRFTPNDIKLCQSLAGQVVAAVQNARLYRTAQDQIEELKKAQARERDVQQQTKVRLQELATLLATTRTQNQALGAREQAAREARDGLEIQLASSRAEADALLERLAVLETDLAQAHANAEAQLRWHTEELARLQEEWAATVQVPDTSQTVFEGMTAGLLITDAQGTIQQANLAAQVFLDMGIEDLQGRKLPELIAHEHWRQAVATASGGEAVRLTMQAGRNTLMCDLSPLPDLDSSPGKMAGLVVVVQDISADIEGYQERLDAVASLAEESRTSITTVVNYTDLLLSDAVGSVGNAQRKFLMRIKAVAERLVQVTSELTRKVNASEGWNRLQRQAIDVSELIESTVAGSHAQLEDLGVTLELHLPDDLPVVTADPDYLRRALSNLLSNACLASSAGGQIQVQAAQTTSFPQTQHLTVNGDGFVIVSVKDSGGGLSDEALDRVFDRSRPRHTPPGLGESGAGLALVKTLVEAQGGRLWVESEKGVGTTFSFVLPVIDVGGRPDRQAGAIAA